MSEIKFRALDSNNEFIYGLPYTDGANETTYFKNYNNRLCWRNEDGAHCNKPYKNGTLQQFTTLHDKNDDEVYQGDSLINSKKEVGVVVWYEAGFYLECKKKHQTFYIPLTKGFLANKVIVNQSKQNGYTQQDSL